MFDFVCDRRLVVVRLRKASPEAAAAVGLAVTKRFEEVGETIFYIALIGTDAENPDAATRAAMLETFERNFDKLAMVRVVVFGSGAKVAILRSVTTVLTLALSMRGKRMHVDRNLRESAQVLAQMLGYDPDEVVARVVSAGLLTRAEVDG